MAEIQIQDLLDTINRDGIEKARKEQEKIVADAKKKAEKIISDAKKTSEDMIAAAKQEQKVFIAQSETAVRQASKNVLLQMKSDLNSMIMSVVKKGLEKSFNENLVCDLLREVLKQTPNKKLVAELSDKIVQSASSALAAEVKNGLEIKGSSSVANGFRLAEKDGSGYYDFSEKELLEMMKPYLSAAVSKALEK